MRAPPAIISIFLGSQLSGILDKIEEMSAEDLINLSAKEGMKLNLTQIPEIMLDSTDRNRTSPFCVYWQSVLSSELWDPVQTALPL